MTPSALRGGCRLPSVALLEEPRNRAHQGRSLTRGRHPTLKNTGYGTNELLIKIAQGHRRQGATPRASRASLTSDTTRAQVQLAEKVGDGYVLPAVGSQALGIVHFIGGAFVGAAPHLSYGLLIQLLAEKGYTVITTPYKVTFNHKECATQTHKAFNAIVEELRDKGREDVVPRGLRVIGVGHSNGALLHLLIGSMYLVPNKTNILISYNNKQVSGAIPIPGLLDALRPAVNALTQEMEGSASSMTQVLPIPGFLDAYTAQSLEPVGQQVADVLREVGDGITDFSPTPSESRSLVRESYSVASTLMVTFDNDSFDETEEMAGILSSKYPSGTRVLKLPGTHVTPLGLDYDISEAKAFPPAYVGALATKAVVQFDQRRLANRLASWMAR